MDSIWIERVAETEMLTSPFSEVEPEIFDEAKAGALNTIVFPVVGLVDLSVIIFYVMMESMSRRRDNCETNLYECRQKPIGIYGMISFCRSNI